MSIFVDETTTVLVQGLTGSQGRFHGLRNKQYGTKVVGGVTPGKGGTDVDGIPVFDTMSEAVGEDRRGGVVRRRAPEGRERGDPRGRGCGDPVHRVHHRGHPGPGRGAVLQPAQAQSSRTPGCSDRIARGSSRRGSATSGSPPATSRFRAGPSGS